MGSGKDNILVAVDSNALVWAIRKQGTKEQLERARWLIEALDDESAQVIIPSVALSEYLTAMESNNHRDAIAELNKRYIISPFDVRCASLAAKLFSEGKGLRAQNVDGGRNCLRADSLIIATAFVHGASRFYTGDKDCRHLASTLGRWEVFDMPTMPHQLWGYADVGGD